MAQAEEEEEEKGGHGEAHDDDHGHGDHDNDAAHTPAQHKGGKNRLRSSSFVVREVAEEMHDASKWEQRADEHGVPMW